MDLGIDAADTFIYIRGYPVHGPTVSLAGVDPTAAPRH
jgi:hypothetical protein